MKILKTIILIACIAITINAQFGNPAEPQYLAGQNLYYGESSALHVRNNSYIQLEVGTPQSTFWGVYNSYGYYSTGQWGDLRGVVHRYGFPLCFTTDYLAPAYDTSACFYGEDDGSKTVEFTGNLQPETLTIDNEHTAKPECTKRGQFWFTESETGDDVLEVCMKKNGIVQWVEK